MSPNRANPEGPYIPAFDGLRALAVICVLFAHFLPVDQAINRYAHVGRFGVILFFVLSGFLITGILLRNRPQPGESGHLGTLGRFYARRALRIFPIYYLVILLGALAGYAPISDHLGWHLTYTASPLGQINDVSFFSANHLWSLSVEEQFYLIWPLLVFLMPNERLGIALGGMIVTAVVFKALGPSVGLPGDRAAYTVLGCIDALGMGALLAWVRHRGSETGDRAEDRLIRWTLRLGLPTLLVLELGRALVVDPRRGVVARTIFDLAAASCFVGLVGAILAGWRHPVVRALEWAPLRQLGKVSYGVYLYHLFLIPLGIAAAAALGVEKLPHGWRMLVLYSALAIGLSFASWRWVEAPLNGLKRFVPYRRDEGATGAAEPSLSPAPAREVGPG